MLHPLPKATNKMGVCSLLMHPKKPFFKRMILSVFALDIRETTLNRITLTTDDQRLWRESRQKRRQAGVIALLKILKVADVCPMSARWWTR